MSKQTRGISKWMAIAAATVLGGATAAQAAVLVEHSGDTDPTTEGFSLNGVNGAGTGIVTEATTGVTNPDSMTTEGGPNGSDAWKVDDNSTDNSGGYIHNFTAAEQTAIQNTDVVITTNVRLLDGNEDTNRIDKSAFVDFDLGFDGGRFKLDMGSFDNGNAEIYFKGDSGGFKTVEDDFDFNFKIEYDADNQQADLIANGDKIFTDIDGGNTKTDSGSNGRLRFGSFSRGGTGQGNYNLVQVATVPEPASLALLGIGSGLILLGPRRRNTHQ